MALQFSKTTRRLIVFLFDLLAIGCAYFAAFLLRFDFRIPDLEVQLMIRALPLIYPIQSAVFIGLGLYRGLWSFASIRDLFLIIRATLLATILSVVGVAFFVNQFAGWPRSIFILDTLFLILILGGGRFSYRLGREIFWTIRKKRKKILVIGAGHSANLIAREFSTRHELDAQVVGFLDDNTALKGVRIHGAPVRGTLNSLTYFLNQLEPDEIIIAIPSLAGTRVKEIVTKAREKQIPCRICPPIRDVLLGNIELNQLREVRVEDLLRRDVVHVDDAAISSFLKDRRILITGAGGSIGSELCRQVLKHGPECLVLFERSEFNLYQFEQELKSTPFLVGSTELAFIIGDILNKNKLSQVFEKYQPEIVLHAAAYKHVPLMEENIYEALNNNIIGTYQLVTAAAAHHVKSFVLISTDKAVRPTSVMGATKRMAELITQTIDTDGSMKVAAVRFGNVLDSEGSVLPLFREQIARGGPITVTDPRVTRYFMTIPEASQLVIQASVFSQGGEVFLLDMGESVLIRELAEELITLSGLRPYEDIDIVFTGLRKGEKLYEELFIDMKSSRRTTHPKIMVSSEEHQGKLPSHWFSDIQQFMQKSTIQPDDELLNWIKSWVPEYCPPAQNDSMSSSQSTTQPVESTYLH